MRYVSVFISTLLGTYLLAPGIAQATNIRGGEIITRQISLFHFEFTVNLYYGGCPNCSREGMNHHPAFFNSPLLLSASPTDLLQQDLSAFDREGDRLSYQFELLLGEIVFLVWPLILTLSIYPW